MAQERRSINRLRKRQRQRQAHDKQAQRIQRKQEKRERKKMPPAEEQPGLPAEMHELLISVIKQAHRDSQRGDRQARAWLAVLEDVESRRIRKAA
jgi:hypothetical protein